MTRRMAAALATAAAVLGLAACGSSAAATHAPPAGTPAANALVCQHYMAQRDHIKNLVNPTLADVDQAQADIDLDASEATGKLHTDLLAMADDMASERSPAASSKRVYEDCT